MKDVRITLKGQLVFASILVAATVTACGGGPEATQPSDLLGANARSSDTRNVITRTTLETLPADSSLEIDLMRATNGVVINNRYGPVLLERVLLVGSDSSITADTLVQTAQRQAGLDDEAPAFVIQATPNNVWPPPPKCSPLNRTNCCQCGWEGKGDCFAVWCPCPGDLCNPTE